MKRMVVAFPITLSLAFAIGGCDEAYSPDEHPRHGDAAVDEPNAPEEEERELVALESEESGEVAEPDELGFQTPLDPMGASNLDHLNTCQWEKASTATEKFIYVHCEGGMNPIAGGCNNDDESATIQSSMPIENASLDFPEADELWYATDGTTGWRCKKGGTAGTLTGVALCCGTPPIESP